MVPAMVISLMTVFRIVLVNGVVKLLLRPIIMILMMMDWVLGKALIIVIPWCLKDGWAIRMTPNRNVLQMILMIVGCVVAITVAVPIVPEYQTVTQLKIIAVSVIMILQMIVLLIAQMYPAEMRIWMIAECAQVEIQNIIQIQIWISAEYVLVIMKTSRAAVVLMVRLPITGMILITMIWEVVQ